MCRSEPLNLGAVGGHSNEMPGYRSLIAGFLHEPPPRRMRIRHGFKGGEMLEATMNSMVVITRRRVSAICGAVDIGYKMHGKYLAPAIGGEGLGDPWPAEIRPADTTVTISVIGLPVWPVQAPLRTASAKVRIFVVRSRHDILSVYQQGAFERLRRAVRHRPISVRSMCSPENIRSIQPSRSLSRQVDRSQGFSPSSGFLKNHTVCASSMSYRLSHMARRRQKVLSWLCFSAPVRDAQGPARTALL